MTLGPIVDMSLLNYPLDASSGPLPVPNEGK